MIILGCDNDWTNLIGNGYCDDDLNNPGCFDDGGDCCGANIDTQFCTECFCYEDCVADFELIGNGMCNDEANNAECNFDGGDCCGACAVFDQCSECACFEETPNLDLSCKHHFLLLKFEKSIQIETSST